MILTPRQAQIMAMLARGLPLKCVAMDIGIGYGNCKVQLHRIRRNNGLRSNDEVRRVALREFKQAAR